MIEYFDLDEGHPRMPDMLSMLSAKTVLTAPREIGMQTGRCYWNVEEIVSARGGEALYGWQLL